MRTIRTKIYSFDELSEAAQQNAINELSNINVDYNWWSFTYDDAKEIGLKITSFDLDRNRCANGEFNLAACEVAQNIFNNHGEHCQTYKTAKNYMEKWQPVFNDYMDENYKNYESGDLEDEMQDLEDEFLKSLLEDYSILLQNNCEYLQSDEAVKETIIANEYEFTKDGKQFKNPLT
jgi:hypothetical protein